MDQIAETTVTLQTLIDQKKAYDDVNADVSTAVGNADTAVSNSALTESGETVSSLVGDVNDQNIEG